MKKFSKIMAVCLAGAMILGMAFPALAASAKRISSVSLVLDAKIVLDESVDDTVVEIDTKSTRFSADYEFTNNTLRWDVEDVPELRIILTIDDSDYYFGSGTNVIVKGNGATMVGGASTRDNGTVMEINVRLTPLNEVMTVPTNLVWSDTTAMWAPTHGAGSYEVKLYREGNAIGTSKTTTDTHFDFGDSMTKAGNYSFKVRASLQTKPDVKSEYGESDSKYVDDAMAAANRQAYSAGVSGTNPETGASWQQNATGWWYKNGDGTYPANAWMMINEKWYYFGAAGYMTVGWTQVGGKWYYLNSDGSMAVGWAQVGDKWYYLNEDGSMAANTEVGGYPLGADGAWIK